MSTVPAATLRDLHRIHSQLADLRDQLQRAPKQLTARKAAVTALEADLAAAQQAVADTRKAADGKQLDVKSQEAKIVNWRGQLNTASSNEVYDTLKEQIAAGEMAASVLEDETLELLERIDELVGAAGRAEEHLAKGKSDFEQFRGELSERVKTVRAEIERLEADLAETEKTLSGDFVAEYKRLVAPKARTASPPAKTACAKVAASR